MKKLMFQYANGIELPYHVIPTGATVGHIDIVMNDLHHFLRSINTTNFAAPTVFSSKIEWFAFYQRWRVTVVDLLVTIQNQRDKPLYFGIATDTVAAGTASTWGLNWTSTIKILRTNKYCKVKLVGPKGSSNDKATLRLKVPLAKLLGDRSLKYDEDYEGGSYGEPAQSPAQLVTGHILLCNTDGIAEASDLQTAIVLRANVYATLMGVERENS